MRKFLIRRSVSLLFTLWAFVTILFLLFRVVPGDPTSMYLADGMSAAERDMILESYGLMDPLHVQYVDYMQRFLTGDFGNSYRYNRPVLDILALKFWNTIFLMGSAFLLAYGVGITVGAYLGWVRGTVKEKTGLIVALVFRSSPEFWIGIVLLMTFVFWLGWFPWGGMRTIQPGTPQTFTERYLTWDFVYHLVLPVVTGAIYYSAQPILLMRSSMISTLNTDFIEMKEAQGINPWTILYAHAARNSILPIITVSAVAFAILMSGSLVIETVFNWPGMGREMVQSIRFNDYPMAQGTFFVMGSFVIVMNFLADIAYVYADPRVKYD